jgi:putative transposase
MGRRGYPPEFRRKVLDLVEAGRPIAEVAKALGISDQSIYTWRRQDRIDRSLEPGLTSGEKAELAAAKRRILEWRPSCRRCGGRWSWSERWCPQKAVPGGRGDGRRAHPGRGGLPGLGRVDLGLLRLAVPATLAEAIRHAWLTDRIAEIHQAARGTYGTLRVHAELRLGRGIMVGDNAVALLLRRAGLAGMTGRPKWRHANPTRSPPTWSTATSPAPGRTSCG